MAACLFWIRYVAFSQFVLDVHMQFYPEVPTVLENNSLTFTLFYKGDSIDTLWTRGSGDVETISSKSCFPSSFLADSNRFSVSCNETAVSVEIKSVERTQNGEKWSCQNMETGAVYDAEVYVIVLVDEVSLTAISPESQEHEIVAGSENSIIVVECKSSYAQPIANITLLRYRNNKTTSVFDDFQVRSTFQNNSENFSRTISTFSFNASRSMNKWTLYCHASNDKRKEVKSNEVLLDILYPPSVGDLNNTSIIEWNNLSKVCPLETGNPPNTSYAWVKGQNFTLSTTEVLNIMNVSRNDANDYTCIVNNTMKYSNGTTVRGSNSKTFRLNVLFPPEKLKVTCLTNTTKTENINDTVSVSQGTHLTLTCSANSNPSPPSYLWNGTIMAGQSELSFIVDKNHSGDIICTANNMMTEIPGSTTVGSTEKAIHFTVLFPPEISEMHNITVIESKYVKFNGKVLQGNPQQTQYIWSRKLDGKVWKNETFSIMSVNRKDESEYTLSVNNTLKPTCGMEGFGKANRTLHLIVLYPPEQFSVKCLADNSINNIITEVFNITEGTNLTLECSAEGKPPPSNFSWSGIMASRDKQLSFFVTNNHSGDYICSASNTMNVTQGNNTVGLSSKTFRMNVLYPPEISTINNITVIEGRLVVFEGHVLPGNPRETQYKWTRLTDQHLWNKSTFSISSVNRNEESEYIFSVSNIMKPTCGFEVFGYRNKTLFMKVLYPPEALQVTCITDSSKNDTIVDVFTITEGTNITLACSANSNPSPSSYSWSGRMVTNQTSLSFYVTKQHSGDYICTVNNSMQEIPGNTTIGTKSKTYRMSVLYAPEVNTMKNTTAVEGERLAVNCTVTLGNPSETTIKWIRKSDNRTWYGETMTIDNVTRHDDNIYTCIANNTLQPTYGNRIIGLTSQNVNVEIFYMASLNSFVIDGHTNINNVTVNETDLVTFRCTVESNPASFMKLTFKDKLLVEKNITKELVHVIYKAKCTDWGTYFCSGHNSHNGLQNIPRTYIDMYVNCAPRQAAIVYPANNVTNVTSGQHVSSTLIFRALAYPKPSVRWYKKQDTTWVELFPDLSNKILITSSEDRLEYNLTVLNITQSDYGQYRLNVSNSFGQHLQIFNLIPNDKPSPPKQFGVYKQTITETSVTLWWEPGFDGGLPQSFIIGIREETVCKNYTSTEDNDALIMNVTVTGLRGGTQYHFCIYASNQLGSTRFPDEITATTTAAPVMKPENSSIAGPAAGGTIGGVLAIALIVLALLFVRKRRMEKMSQEDKHNHEYQNMSFMKDSKQQKRLPPLPNEDLHDNHDRQHLKTHQVEETHPDKNTTEFKRQQKSKEVKQNPVYENMNLTEDAKQNKRYYPDPIEDGQQMHQQHKGGVSKDNPDPKTSKLKMQQKPIEVKQHPEYENMNLTEDAKHRKRLPLIPPDDAYEVPDQQNQTHHVKDADDYPYPKTLDLLEIINKISLSDLFSYVTSKTLEDYVHEYTRFPMGMMDLISHSFARKPQNAPLNRYQGIYPYDHSRVVIPAEPDFFINANYIDGHSKEKAYIASLGPTVRHTLGFQTFWKMVWHENSDVIVMLTNLQEPSGMKCEKYWADQGTTREVGDFTIQSVSEEVAGEYIVRTFNVTKKGESRSVTQLHYTAWPDKKVPEDVTSLIEFWQRVKAAPTRSLGPLVVHCSAGIGRTGTYIALDRLFEEGKTTNYVNVFDCVMSMRQQRVNMVQTQDQYIYLHQALVYCLVFDTEPVTADKIEEYVKTTSHNVYIKLFEQLKQNVEVESTYETEARTRNSDDDERNRTQADIPGDAHRVRLFLDKGSNESDYINAVYLNSFKRLGYYIIAQSPLPNTVNDFVSMLYQENCCCIVSLDDYQQKGTNNAVYLPAENQHATYGTCTISSTMLNSKSAYSIRKLTIGHSTRFEKGMKIAHHFEYTGLKHDERIPKDVNMFVEFVQEVEEYATQLADEHSHVLVHCLTGSGRSGLFCAVSNLIQKMGQERQVSVVNTLRQVRARRQTAIRNTEQLKFCYQSVYAFVKNYKV